MTEPGRVCAPRAYHGAPWPTMAYPDYYGVPWLPWLPHGRRRASPSSPANRSHVPIPQGHNQGTPSVHWDVPHPSSLYTDVLCTGMYRSVHGALGCTAPIKGTIRVQSGLNRESERVSGFRRQVYTWRRCMHAVCMAAAHMAQVSRWSKAVRHESASLLAQRAGHTLPCKQHTAYSYIHKLFHRYILGLHTACIHMPVHRCMLGLKYGILTARDVVGFFFLPGASALLKAA